MVNRKDPAKHREQVRSANRARYRAVKRLIAAHAAEFDALYAEEAEVEGVSPKPISHEHKIEELRKEITELEAALRAL
jgi:uncharacterized sporulation protein YeaH/YhbH (DUF444 family)